MDHDDLSTAWRELLAAAADTEARMVDEGFADPGDLAESYRHLATMLSMSIDMFVLSRPEAPALVRAFNGDDDSERKFLGDSADTRYRYANVSGDRRYRICGRRGDETHLSFIAHRGDPVDHRQQFMISSLNHHEIAFGPDGSFEIVLSCEPHEGNWMRLDETACCVLIREYYDTRVGARFPHITIELLDASERDAGPVLLDPLPVEQGVRQAAQFLRAAYRPFPVHRGAESNVFTEPFRFHDGLPSWGTPDNTYARCHFDLTDEEVLVVEGELVPCDYWSVQLWNREMQSIGAGATAASVNRVQAGLGDHDAFRVLVGVRDPGGRPWLDTQGHRRGTVYVRWLGAQELPPRPTARVVTRTELDASLP